MALSYSSSSSSSASSLNLRDDLKGSLAPEPNQVSDKTKNCIACLVERGSTDGIILAPCGYHAYCHHCTKRIILASYKFGNPNPPTCCYGRGSFTEETIELLLDEDELTRFRERRRELTMPVEKRMYCPNCSKLFEHEEGKKSWLIIKAGDRKATCDSCGTNMCTKCRSRYHDGKACKKDKEAKLVVRVGRLKGWRKCPKCKVMIEKISGCNSMWCTCGTHFCYLCKKVCGGSSHRCVINVFTWLSGQY